MKHEDYLQKVKELESEFEIKKTELMKQFVMENNPYKIGDKVTDHIGSIIVERISYSWGWKNKPCASYFGLELTKKGEINKRGSKRIISQLNLV